MNQQILAEKKETVSKINETLKVSHSVVIVSYSGLSVADVTQLRIDLKKAGARLSVHKNSLLKKAVDEDGLSQLDGLLKGLERPQPLTVDAIAGRVVPQQQTIHPRQISPDISQYVPIRMVENNDSQ